MERGGETRTTIASEFVNETLLGETELLASDADLSSVAMVAALATDAVRNKIPLWIHHIQRGDIPGHIQWANNSGILVNHIPAGEDQLATSASTAQAQAEEPKKEHKLKVPDIDIVVRIDKQSYKKTWGVAIPGAEGGCGIHLAAALGVVVGTDQGQDIFRNIGPVHLQAAHHLIKGEQIIVEVAEEAENLFIEVTALPHKGPKQEEYERKRKRAETESDRQVSGMGGRATLAGKRRLLIHLDSDGYSLLGKDFHPSDESPNRAGVCTQSSTTNQDNSYHKRHERRSGASTNALRGCTLEELVFFATSSINRSLAEHLLAGARLNLRAASKGLLRPYGPGIGAKLASIAQKGSLGFDAATTAGMRCAAASDVMMSGELVTMMSSAGWICKGIILSLPVLTIAAELGKSNEMLCSALALANLVSIASSAQMGCPSPPLCGASVEGGMGAAAGVALCLGGGVAEIAAAIQNMASDNYSKQCDGAGDSCSLKLWSSAAAAVRCALLAAEGVKVSKTAGTVDDSFEETLINIGGLARAMKEAERTLRRTTRTRTRT